MCEGTLQVSGGAWFLVFFPSAGAATRFYDQGDQSYEVSE